MLLTKVFPALLLQDNTRKKTTNETQNCFSTWNFDVVCHTPYSPGMVSNDLYAFCYLLERFSGVLGQCTMLTDLPSIWCAALNSLLWRLANWTGYYALVMTAHSIDISNTDLYPQE